MGARGCTQELSGGQGTLCPGSVPGRLLQEDGPAQEAGGPVAMDTASLTACRGARHLAGLSRGAEEGAGGGGGVVFLLSLLMKGV